MSNRRCVRAAVVLACGAFSACAPVPPVVEAEIPTIRAAPPALPNAARGTAIARHVRIAASARESGDLAAAADHEELLVLLAPDDPSHKRSLDATRDAIRRGVREQAQAGAAARTNGDFAVARDAFLRVLALDPDNADAAKALRDVEQQAMSRAQGERAARVRATENIIANVRARSAESFDLEQRLELIRAGDLTAGLRELRAWVDASPGDRAARQRIGAAVAEKARESEAKGQREAALGLYEQAVSLAGAGTPEWSARMQALRKALGEQYYADGMRVFRSDLAAAIRQWENGAKYDPSNTNLQIRLREAKLAQQKLQRMEK